MHHLIYMSTAAQTMTDENLAQLLETARTQNARNNITGALVYGSDRFMQIIEGEEVVLADLYARLLADPRHTGVVKLADKEIMQRSFIGWSMAFQPISDSDFSSLAGYVAPNELDLRASNLSAADDLLLQMMKSFVFQPRSEE